MNSTRMATTRASRAALTAVLFLFTGCNQFNRLVNGDTRRNDPSDTSPNPVYVTGVTSFDYDTVYNLSGASLVQVKRPTDAVYWTLNIFEYSYDATAHALHFGKLVAVSGGDPVVESDPAAPTGTLYRIEE